MSEAIRSDKKRLYILSFVTLALLAAALFIPSKFSKIPSAVIAIALAATVFILIKKRSVPSVNRRQVLLITIGGALLYVAIIYILGLYFGFVKPAVPLNLKNLFTVTIPVTVIIVASEITRYVLLCQEDRSALVISYLIGIASELLVFSGADATLNLSTFMEMVGFALLPALFSGIFLTYASKRYGFMPCAFYRAITTLYTFILPFVPAMPGVLISFSRILLPLLLMSFIMKLFEKSVRKARRKNKLLGYIATALTVVLIIAFVALISCQFKYSLIVIGSESMTGEIDKGDAVVYESYDGDILSKDQIIVFKKDGRLLVHRIIDIQKINGVLRFYTKGDANEDPDPGYITEENIVGTVNFKIAYIGYPTLWVDSLFQ